MFTYMKSQGVDQNNSTVTAKLYSNVQDKF